MHDRHGELQVAENTTEVVDWAITTLLLLLKTTPHELVPGEALGLSRPTMLTESEESEGIFEITTSLRVVPALTMLMEASE